MLDLERELQEAVAHFWKIRGSQSERQGMKSGLKDSGNRAAVTGGKHGDGFIGALSAILRESGLTDAEIHVRQKTLPCYFRPAKDWDLIVKLGDDLIAVIEIKAHIGSFGNNFNNRVEEALGSATDFWAAYAEATFKPSARPWLGYLMMLEEAPVSTRPTKLKRLPHYPMRNEFQCVSYARRYEMFCERLVRERLYDATCFLMSSAKDGPLGIYTEPNTELSFRNFAASLSARATAFMRMKQV
ncbi:MAG: PaeR7I family type II restriction endonuclease [Panacagrimonas sp.]